MGSESRLQFAKMHGLGNDFVVIDLVRQTLPEGWLAAERIRRLADRHFGIGFDQLLLVEPARSVDNDFRYRIFNADGGEVEQCGNGARCFARFVVEQGLFHGETVRVETRAGDIVLQLDADGQVTVNMGSPRLAPADIPFRNDGLEQGAQGAWFLPLDLTDSHGGFVALFPVSMGNPHAVIQVESTEAAPVESWGPWLEQHPQFPARVNVGFMQVQARDEIRLRVYERGAGETLACGTGACAAVVAGIHQGWLDSTVRVHLRGGDLQITYDGQLGPVMMRGPAATVFTGSMSLDAGSDPA